jgi:hypothetical protein
MYITLAIIIYLIGGYITVGAEVAYSQNEYPNMSENEYVEHLANAIAFSFCCPVLWWIIMFFYTEFYKYGISFKP